MIAVWEIDTQGFANNQIICESLAELAENGYNISEKVGNSYFQT